MRRLFLPIAVGSLVMVAAGIVNVTLVGPQPDGSFIVPTGQTITPAGTHIEVADRPLGMALSPDGNLLAVVTGSNFASRRIHLIDARAGSVAQSIAIGDSFVGVAFSADGQMLYVGGGRDNNIKIYRKDGSQFRQDALVAIAGSAPSGLSVAPGGAPAGDTLYVALNLKNTVAILDTKTRSVVEAPVGSYPYTTAATLDGSKVYISNWGGRRPQPEDATNGIVPVMVDPKTGIANSGTLSVLDAASRAVTKSIEVGLHPSALALSADGSRLYVTNANSDTISVVSTATDAVEKTLNVRLFAGAPLGSAPNALAASADGKTLYVANAANNAVAVVEPDRAENPVRGFIPTGWFPAAVALSADGRKLYVASGYGFGSIAPAGRGRSYADRVGVVSILDVPDENQLARYTAQVLRNNGAPGSKGFAPAGAAIASSRPHPIPMNLGQESPIRYVFYIIKENRTYDQVFGDLPQGNGDASLVQFGREVTPNHHALAEQFVLLDNFYTTGDQSALGHQWCDEAYANDYAHKYGNARNDFAGTNPMAYAPTGFLWDHARNNGRTVRMYGEFAISIVSPLTATWTDIYNDWQRGSGRIRVQSGSLVAGLSDILNPRYAGFDMRVTEQTRVDEFLREFRQYAVRPPRSRSGGGGPPRLIILLLPMDHTNGTSPGFPTPRAMVADNDLGLGRLVEAISRSPWWPQSAIFVTEDDSQNGLDHVDGHRTVGLVISPWARRRVVDSTLYTTIHMFRTIEQILGLPPLNQFDLAVEPMFSVFTDQADFSPYTALPNRIPLDEMNPPLARLTGLERQLAEESMKMDFSEPDAAPEDLLNRVIWHSVKGYGVPYPKR